MSNFEEYKERVDLYSKKKIKFKFQVNFRKTIDNYLKWKQDILIDIYENDSIFLIEWQFLDENEKALYSHNSENYKRKYILLFEIELFVSFLDLLKENFKKIYPVLWKDCSLTNDYFSNLYPKIKTNIEIRYLLLDLNRLKQYYLTDFEKDRLSFIKKSVKELEEKINRRFIPIESYMKIFYKTNFQKINSYDIRREIFSYL